MNFSKNDTTCSETIKAINAKKLFKNLPLLIKSILSGLMHTCGESKSEIKKNKSNTTYGIIPLQASTFAGKVKKLKLLDNKSNVCARNDIRFVHFYQLTQLMSVNVVIVQIIERALCCHWHFRTKSSIQTNIFYFYSKKILFSCTKYYKNISVEWLHINPSLFPSKKVKWIEWNTTFLKEIDFFPVTNC